MVLIHLSGCASRPAEAAGAGSPALWLRGAPKTLPAPGKALAEDCRPLQHGSRRSGQYCRTGTKGGSGTALKMRFSGLQLGTGRLRGHTRVQWRVGGW